ncbi:MAG: hypothetical protein PHS93_07170 [Candidatus Omnitrophica bacterium]|nr:hypothetical protein [Candidatus Omnitrophota bacterium]MDD5352922.1 hypothetical protein [Candidatus Omnitrophota bacterium]MDD5550521.1 hypothetical protein [Candidatus Omnitrophota bacterium]
MDSSAEKIFGYVLFFIGLACIVFALFSMYNVFTDVSKPPEIFQMQSLSITTTSVANGSQPTVVNIALDAQARKVVNVFLYYLFMLFIVMAGGRISSLGIQFSKEIKAEMKS